MTEPSPLVDQRDFLLRSIEDLEAEWAAGDLDEADYRRLKDHYTARTAAVLRAMEGGPVRSAARGGAGRRRLAWVAAVLVFAGLSAALVAQSSGRRDAGQLATGDIRRTVTEKLNQAGQRFADGDADGAIALYDEVLADQPTNAEALTYKGWAQFILQGEAEAGLTTLLDAATAHPEYPDVHAFLAVVFARSGLLEQAQRELDRLDALDPPPDIVELTSELRAQLADALGAPSTTTSTTG